MYRDIKKNPETIKSIYLILFLLLALYLSIAEAFIPKPFPWLKLGLANIVTILVLEKFDLKTAIELTLLRVFIQNITFGTIFTPTFVISIMSGSASVIVMGLLFKVRDKLSLVSISIVSALVHNLVQLVVVYFLLFRNISIYSKYTFIFILVFTGIGIFSGFITGVICEKINIRRIKIIK